MLFTLRCKAQGKIVFSDDYIMPIFLINTMEDQALSNKMLFDLRVAGFGLLGDRRTNPAFKTCLPPEDSPDQHSAVFSLSIQCDSLFTKKTSVAPSILEVRCSTINLFTVARAEAPYWVSGVRRQRLLIWISDW